METRITGFALFSRAKSLSCSSGVRGHEDGVLLLLLEQPAEYGLHGDGQQCEGEEGGSVAPTELEQPAEEDLQGDGQQCEGEEGGSAAPTVCTRAAC